MANHLARKLPPKVKKDIPNEEIKRRLDEGGYKKFLTRILNRIQIDDNGCWLWQGCKSKDTGYGQLNLYHYKKVKPHRFIAYCFHGLDLFDLSLDACHTCDVRHCVNPFHIWIGTRSQNFKDAVAKGRWHGGSYLFGNYYNDLTQG